MSVDIQKCRAFLEKRDEVRQKRLQERLHQARRDFEAVKNCIIEKYAPECLYQWGSLLHEEDFSEIADIDIAVGGSFSAEDFFAMYGDAMRLSELPVDLVELDKIEPEFREQIIRSGRLVYDRQKPDS